MPADGPPPPCDGAAGPQGRVAVLACSPTLMVGIERRHAREGAEVHLHPGGQGFWAARMAARLGAHVTLVGPFGGEPGIALRALIEDEGVAVVPVDRASPSGVWVSDRQEGEDASIAEVVPPPLTRHELDALVTTMLAEGLRADISLITGCGLHDLIDESRFRHLAHDLHAVGGRVAADLSGEALHAALEGGLDLVKVSASELVDAGIARSEARDDLMTGLRELARRGPGIVLVSRAEEPLLAACEGECLEVETPSFRPVNHRGAGDSMTGAACAAVACGRPPRDALRLAVAAGALNVTRVGLGTGHADAIEELARRVHVRPATSGAREAAGRRAG